MNAELEGLDEPKGPFEVVLRAAAMQQACDGYPPIEIWAGWSATVAQLHVYVRGGTRLFSVGLEKQLKGEVPFAVVFVWRWPK